jgi:hypothetical protein
MAEHGLKARIQRQVANPLLGRLAALEANEQGNAAPVAVAEAQVVEEDIGLGDPAFGSPEAAEIAMLQRKIKALTKKPKFQAPLIERIAEIRAAVAAAAEQGAQ